jgi:hypothetical protein
MDSDVSEKKIASIFQGRNVGYYLPEIFTAEVTSDFISYI